MNKINALSTGEQAIQGDKNCFQGCSSEYCVIYCICCHQRHQVIDFFKVIVVLDFFEFLATLLQNAPKSFIDW